MAVEEKKQTDFNASRPNYKFDPQISIDRLNREKEEAEYTEDNENPEEEQEPEEDYDDEQDSEEELEEQYEAELSRQQRTEAGKKAVAGTIEKKVVSQIKKKFLVWLLAVSPYVLLVLSLVFFFYYLLAYPCQSLQFFGFSFLAEFCNGTEALTS